MRKLKKLLTWIWLLNKRLFRKPTFLVILVLIPLLTAGYGVAATQQSGLVTIVLAQEGTDPIGEQIIDELLGSSELILFREAESARDAVDQVAHGKADAAWIFSEDLEDRIEAFVRDPDSDNAFVRVVQREEKVLLMLTREVLGGKMFHLCAQSVYSTYIREHSPELSEIPQVDLLEYYENCDITGELFTYEQTDGTIIDKGDGAGYLMTPIRGLLAVVITLCGMATAIYYTKDCGNGTFAWLPVKLRPAAELGCQLVSVVDVSLAALISLLVLGVSGGILRELVVVVLYSLCVAAFSMVLRRLCGSIRWLGILMPVLVVTMLLVCPVFFDLGVLRNAQFLFPATYYINGVYNSKYLLYMIVYICACGCLYGILGKVLKRDCV